MFAFYYGLSLQVNLILFYDLLTIQNLSGPNNAGLQDFTYTKFRMFVCPIHKMRVYTRLRHTLYSLHFLYNKNRHWMDHNAWK